MNISIHQRVRNLLEETNDAYASYDTVNADFADFAVLAFSEFKNVLGDPGLTQERLVKTLRHGMARHAGKDPASWSVFMAHHIANTVGRSGRMINFTAAWRSAGDALKTA
jgi:hypothetical protein